MISPELDLVDAAYAIHRDNTAQIESWQKQGLITGVSNDQARLWHETKAEVWAVVIKPWVLVQAIK